MKLTTPMQITAADSETRTITGRIVAFNEQANASTGKVVFARGSVVPKDVFLNLEHDRTRRIGKTSSMSVNDKEITASFKIANTTAGSDALEEAMTGLRDGFSIELAVDDYIMETDGVMKVLQGQLMGVALVTEPAVRSARVSEVAATEEDSEIKSDDTQTPTEGDAVENTTVIEETPAAETVEASQTINTSKPAPFYTKPRSPIINGATYLEHTLRASFGNEDSRQYVKAADDDTTTNTGLTLAPHMNEFISSTLGIRPAIDSVSRGVLPSSGMSFTIPKLTTAPTVATIAEGVAPSETGMVSTYITVDVKKASGLNRISYELLDRSSPAFFAELLSQMQKAYAKATDQALLTALISGGTAGTAVAATAAGLQSFVATESAAAFLATGEVAQNLIANTAQWGAILGYADSTGRALYNASNPNNNSGVSAVSSLNGNVLGLNLAVDPFFSVSTVATDSAVIVVPSAVTWYESPTTQIQVQAVTTGEVEIALYGYYAIATKIGAGIRRFTKSA